jgi:hypothetical protein
MFVLYRVDSGSTVHIVQFYQFRDVFSRYQIYHFEDFSCVHPVSIDSGKTHQKPPAHSSVFRGFFGKMYLLYGLSKIREKYIKKVLRIVLDYRCIHPVLRKNYTCVIPVSNFRRRWPHDPVSTHE